MLLLLLTDVITLILFVLVGQREHDTFNLLTFALNWAAFALPWGVVNWLRRGFEPAQLAQPRQLLAHSLSSWLMAAPLGIALRALVFGRATIPLGFFFAALGFGGLFVVGGRLVLALVQRHGKPKEPEKAGS